MQFCLQIFAYPSLINVPPACLENKPKSRTLCSNKLPPYLGAKRQICPWITNFLDYDGKKSALNGLKCPLFFKKTLFLSYFKVKKASRQFSNQMHLVGIISYFSPLEPKIKSQQPNRCKVNTIFICDFTRSFVIIH